MSYVVPAWFRSLLLTQIPQLACWPEGLELAGHLLFSIHREGRGEGVPISRYTLAHCEGRSAQASNHNYCGLDFLIEFQRRAFPHGGFWWQEYRYIERRCRVAFTKWPNAVREGLRRLESDESDDRVFLGSGLPATAQHASADRKALDDEAEAKYRSVKWDKACTILKYLNSLPAWRFAPLRKNANSARNRVRELYRDGQISKVTRDGQLQLLHRLEFQPKPYYQPSPCRRTDRLFPLGSSICGLKREVRKLFCAGWWEADLKNAQLAIVAEEWQLPKTERFLRQGKSIWADLMDFLFVPNDKRSAAKPILKKFLYSIIFGMSKRSAVNEQLSRLLALGLDWAPTIWDHRLIQELWKARGRQLRLVIHAGGLHLCHGEWVPVKGKTIRERIAAARSALARQAQAVELDLIYPVYELASKHQREFRVVLHQHDGVSVSFSRYPELWKERISAAVRQRANELGIHTELEWEFLEHPVLSSTGAG